MIPHITVGGILKPRSTARPRVQRGWTCDRARKSDLVNLGLWGLRTSRGWLVLAVHVALIEEGLTHV